jgi:hypothetical protein
MGLFDKPQFWMNHYSIRFPPPGIRREPKEGRKLPISVKDQTEADFKRELLRPRSPTEMMLLRIPDLPPVIVRMQRVGQTALVAFWLRGDALATECITLCLGGLDDSEDEGAILIASERLSGGDERVNTMIQQLMGHIRKEPRPAGAHVHLDELSYDSQALRVCSNCLAVAFFDQFGAEKVRPGQ